MRWLRLYLLILRLHHIPEKPPQISEIGVGSYFLPLVTTCGKMIILDVACWVIHFNPLESPWVC